MPVKISQLLTTPAESAERAIQSFACSLMDLIGAEANDIGSGTASAESIGEVLSCQSLTDPSNDNEMREEENVMDSILLECPMKVPTR